MTFRRQQASTALGGGAPLHYRTDFSVVAAPQPVNFTPKYQSRNAHILSVFEKLTQ
jgi:hypothetical protein